MSTNLFLQIGADSPLSRIKTYFDALQNSANEYFFVKDLNAGQTLLSKNFLRDFNFPEELVEDFTTLIMPFIWHDDREIFESAMVEIDSVNPGDEVFCEFRMLNSLGEYGWVSLRMTAGTDEFGQPELIAGVIARMDLKQKADSVTGLLNRNAFQTALMQELNSSPDVRGAVVFIGLDNFQLVNETYGHDFGDNALKQLAQDIIDILPPDIRLYKLDNDMFAFFVEDVYPEELEIIFSSVQLCMREIRNVEDTIFCTASAGATFFPEDAYDVTTLMRYAEVAPKSLSSTAATMTVGVTILVCKTLCKIPLLAVARISSFAISRKLMPRHKNLSARKLFCAGTTETEQLLRPCNLFQCLSVRA